jgi:hypothetical protein
MRASTACAILALTLSGCGTSGIGDVLGGVLGGGQQQPTNETGTVVAEVRSVDTRDQLIRIRTDDGQTADIRYDSRTTVVYRDRQYDVDALEAGDVVRMDITRNNQNEYYTDQIEVEQSVQDRTGQDDYNDDIGSDRLYQLTGRVGAIDRTRGRFTVQMSNGVTATVTMPYDPRTADRDRFVSLRSGNTVRVEGRWVDENVMELARFL